MVSRGTKTHGTEQTLSPVIAADSSSRGSRVVKVSDRGWLCHEFEPSTTKDLPCRGAMHVKSIDSSNFFPLVWCGS
ncbi:hypothetical protein TNCV_369241 [Trichonephila clavipes]|nr:hypothetical protein TNCV_369241 [Trichonephila clavipes]